jgi:hypothetical protein
MTLVFLLMFVCVFRLLQNLDMQCCRADHKTGSTTQPHNAMWTSEFCLHFFIFHRMHKASILPAFLGQMFAGPYIILGQMASGRGGVCFPCEVVCGCSTLPPL